ncbi:HAMP domain-containing sensor histidine kinase [Clostridium sp. UBA1056]|uniref:sensor histidine kinase n=1 Tax=unclassified Clostridium TaxID=2614128 RepID=UPI003217C0FC
MSKKLPIRLRLTAMIVALLTVCCVGLTLILNLSANKMVAALMVPAQDITQGGSMYESIQPPSDAASMGAPDDSQKARMDFRLESILYMLSVIMGGGVLTYYLSGKALKPIDTLNGQIKNRTVHNLSEAMDVPPTNDEISELTESFNEMTDKLNHAFMMQQRFSANAAHELRTPLTVLKTKVDVFKKKNTHSNEEYDALIATFEKQINRLSELVHNLLDMTNMTDEFENERVCIKDVLDDIVTELSSIAAEKDITLTLDCNNSVVMGNTDLLHRAFYNLIENGIKYNMNGGNVSVTASSNKLHTVIKISDTGIGIPNEMKKNIFEPFYRVDKSRSRKIGGAGLGLAIVESIIKKHNGKIEVTDNKTGGTYFKITLDKLV